MENKVSIYLNFLNKKNELLQGLLTYVSSKNFKISESEVEHIYNYLTKRDDILESLNLIDKDIRDLHLTDKEKNNSNVLNLVQKNDILIKNILEEDKKNSKKFKEISSLIKNNIKNIKNVDKANRGYNSIYNTQLFGGNFDSKS